MEMENIRMTVVLGQNKAQKVLPFLSHQQKEDFPSTTGSWKRLDEANEEDL